MDQSSSVTVILGKRTSEGLEGEGDDKRPHLDTQVEQIARRIFPGIGSSQDELIPQLEFALKDATSKSSIRIKDPTRCITGLWYRKGKEGKWITVVHLTVVGSGQFKTICEATKVFVPENLNRDLQFYPCVISQVEEPNIKVVKKGIAQHEEIFEEIEEAEKYFVEPPFIYPSYNGAQGEILELESKRQDGSLQDFIQGFCIQKNKSFVYITPMQMIQGLKNVALGIKELEDISMIHQDIVSQNILVKVEEDGEIRFLISDFDRTFNEIPPYDSMKERKEAAAGNSMDKTGQKASIRVGDHGKIEVFIPDSDHIDDLKDERKEAPHLNFTARVFSLITKETDVFSLVLLIAQALILDFNTLVDKEGDEDESSVEDKNSVEAYRDLIRGDQGISQGKLKELRATQIKTLKELLPNERHFLLEPFIDYYGEVTEQNTSNLMQYAKELEEEKNYFDAAVIRRFIQGLKVSEIVFSLLSQTLRADLASYVAGDEYDFSEDAALEQLESAGFPTIDEVILVLDELHQLLAVEPVAT